MDMRDVGTAGLAGWRGRVGDAVAAPVANHSRVREDDVRAAVGFLFLVLSTLYVLKSVRRMVAES